MITIIHGDNTTASRTELHKLKSEAKGKEIRDIDGKRCDENILRQAMESSSLFGNTLLVVVENLFTNLGRKLKETKTIAALIAKSGEETDIVLWESKEVGKTALGGLPKATVKLYKTPAVIFEFLDSIKPNSARSTLLLLEETLKTEPEELLLYMLQTRMRHLIACRDNTPLPSLSPWQRSRLTNQAKLFTMNKLLMMHTHLSDLEYSYKTGTTPLQLTQGITHYIIKELSA